MANDMLTSGGIQVGWGSQWETLANAINDYYGGGISSAQYQQVVQMLNSGEYTMQEMESIIGNIPEFNRTYNAAGQLTQVSYKATAAGNTAAGSAANAINSNVATAEQTQFQTVQTITKNSQTGKVTMSDNVTKYNSGVAGTTKAIATSAVQGILAAGVGIKLGKTIDQLAYNLGFNWLSWAGVDMEDLNPEKWGSITAGENSAGAKLFNVVFEIDPYTENPQPYISQDAFAYMTAYMLATGVFSSGDYDIIDQNQTVGGTTITGNMYKYPTSYYRLLRPNLPSLLYTDYIAFTSPADVVAMYDDRGSTATLYIMDCGDFTLVASNTSLQRNTGIFNYITGDPTGGGTTAVSNYNYNSKTVYYAYFTNPNDMHLHDVSTPSTLDKAKLAWLMVYGTSQSSGGGVEGITDQTGATQFNPAGLDDPSNISAILAALLTQYPDLWNNRLEISPDGDTTYVYLPIGFPTGGVEQNPTTNGATQSDLAPDISGDGDNATDELIKTLIDMIQNPQDQNGMESDTDIPTEPIDPNMPNTGGGVTPPYVTPTGSASALYSVYNPSQTELNSLGAWLWSSNFVDQLLKLFNDPMQAIIGLHKIFATPPTSGTGNIKVGYLDSGVSANLVSAQYTEIDCGTVKIDEYFKNALDYIKTDIYLYLPFIGIVPLSVEDVTRANVNVKYKVDVLTGACLATVNVTRDANGGGQLYTYAGNCAVQYPLSSGSYMGIVASALGIAGSVAGTILSGGAMLPMALGVGASALGGARTRVEHSGSLSGNSGAMGIKKPYLIIRRPQTKIADNFEFMAGVNNNVYDVLSGFSGLTRVKYVHLENIPATSDELAEIETLLKSGVMI